MASLSFMPLGLPASHPFWTDAPQPWTQVKAWGGQPMLNDTLAETLVAYFDRHGNANERNHNYYTARQVRLIAEYLCID